MYIVAEGGFFKGKTDKNTFSLLFMKFIGSEMQKAPKSFTLKIHLRHTICNAGVRYDSLPTQCSPTRYCVPAVF